MVSRENRINPHKHYQKNICTVQKKESVSGCHTHIRIVSHKMAELTQRCITEGVVWESKNETMEQFQHPLILIHALFTLHY